MPLVCRLEVDNCEPGTSTAQALQDIMTTQQSAFNIIAEENSRLQQRCESLQRENTRLMQYIDQLKNDNARIRSGGGDPRGGAGPVYAAPTCESPAVDATDGIFALERRIIIHSAPVHSVAMGPSNDVVATASWDALVKLYNLETEEVLMTLGDASEDEKMNGLYAVAFSKTSPDILGCTSADHHAYLWNNQTRRMTTKMVGHNDEVNGIDFHSSQTVMCTASDDMTCIVWDFAEGITLRKLDKHTKAVYGCTFLGDNEYLLATCCFDQKTRVFDMRNKNVVAQLQRHTDDVIGIDYCPTKGVLATGSDDGMIGIIDTKTWKFQQMINTREDPGAPDNEVKRVVFSPDGNYLAAACSSERVLVYDVSKPRASLVSSLGGHMDCVFDVTWGVCPSTGVRLLVSASHDQTCQYWREIR